MKKMRFESADKHQENIEKIGALFPGVITETVDENGNLRKAVNFEFLKQELSAELLNACESYEFNWIGKRKAILESLTPTLKTLRPCISESKDWETTKNLYIEGDNLDVLKLLQKGYRGRIKMIYIDPPYNTGNDIIYRDDYSIGRNDYREHLSDGENRAGEISGRIHSGWCSMIYPRLKLARDLLTDDGVIFISIDDNELENLKKICGEIFGESSFVTMIGLEITKTQGMKVKSAKQGSIVKNYEYILCYSKNGTNKKIVKNLLYDRNEGYDKHFCHYIEKKGKETIVRKLTDVLAENREILEEFKKYHLTDKKGNIRINSLETAISVSGKIRNHIYSVLAPNIYQEMACAVTPDPAVRKQLDSEKIVEYKGYLLTKSTGGKIRQYSSLAETLGYNDEYRREYGRVTIRGNLWKGFYSDMMNVAREGGVEYKNGKKPVRLIYQLAKWIGVGDDDIVLDFFSGSATTAHAVMQLNADDNGKRSFIVVQLDEDLDEAYKNAAGEARRIIGNTIRFLDGTNRPHFLSELGKERIIRAGDKIKKMLEEKTNKEAGGGNYPALDTGFRVFRLDSSHMNEYPNEGYDGGIGRNSSYMKENRTEMDLLYGIILDLGVMLSANPTAEKIGNSTVYTIHEKSAVVCFSEKIPEDVISAIAKRKPEAAVFRPDGLSLLKNIEYVFSEISPNTELFFI